MVLERRASARELELEGGASELLLESQPVARREPQPLEPPQVWPELQPVRLGLVERWPAAEARLAGLPAGSAPED